MRRVRVGKLLADATRMRDSRGMLVAALRQGLKAVSVFLPLWNHLPNGLHCVVAFSAAIVQQQI